MDCEKLLQAGYKSVSMGISSLGFIIGKVESTKLEEELKVQLVDYNGFMDQLVQLLNKDGVSPKDISQISKVSANVSAAIQLMGDDKDEKIIDMVIKGTQMGIDELEKELEECHDKSKKETELISTIVKAYKKNITAIRKLA